MSKGRNGPDEVTPGTNASKKPFNKKKWRKEKYSIKEKVKRWDEKRRRILMREYRKEMKKEGIALPTANKKNEKGKTAIGMKKAQIEYKKKEEERKKRILEQQKVREERNAALAAYRERKAARFKKLSLKTKKGQPVMRGRIELLLEKIEKEYANS